MYRLLLPGLRIKRWLLINLIGMFAFALGFSLLLSPDLRIDETLWRLWSAFFKHTMPQFAPTIIGLVLVVCGLMLMAMGTRRLIVSFTSAANPQATGRQLIQALLKKRQSSPKLKIVGIGGGTGLSTLLRGLKTFPLDLTAIVTVTDDGGSSGRLRKNLDMPPPGDIRHCLVALAEAEPLMERLFQHRFTEGGDLRGHTLGNLVIAGLSEMTGDFYEAIKQVSRVLAVRGRVLPSANKALVLKAVMEDGTEVRGETAIVQRRGVIADLGIDPPDVSPLPEALQAIRQADVIIVGPGSVYSSLLPNLLIPGMAEALTASHAIVFFVCNVMTQPGESDAFSASRHLEVVLKHLPYETNPFHFAVVNMQRPPEEVLATYAEKDQHFVEPDLQRLRELGSEPITGNLMANTPLARHDPDRLAESILQVIAEETRWPNLSRRRG